MTRDEKPFEPEFNAAVSLYQAGDALGASNRLQALVSQFPNEAAIHGVLGGYLREAGLEDRALPHAKVAVELSPQRENPARLLFHILLELKHFSEAQAELLRFLSTTSDEALRDEWNRLLEETDVDA